ncbi:MAG: hypothetical protein LBP28_03380 [Coriobacteriales bacterium]|nr:hypothetical protein [Coriobacteriales bacterium]
MKQGYSIRAAAPGTVVSGTVVPGATTPGTVVDLGALGPQAIGRISPQSTAEGSLFKETLKILDALYSLTSQEVVTSCIDGRSVCPAPEGLYALEKTASAPSPASGANRLSALEKGPDAAGATLALWVAVVLSGHDLPLEGFLRALRDDGVPIGGHSDDHEHSGASGCGANDKLETILQLINNEQTLSCITGLAKGLGMVIEPKCAARLARRAGYLTESPLLGTAAQRLSLIEEYGQSVVLCGGHSEQLIIINTVPKTTLNRSLLKERLGENAAAFNVDLWAFEPSLRRVVVATGLKNPDFDDLFAALLFYNLATALVLCGPEMRVVLRSSKGT